MSLLSTDQCIYSANLLPDALGGVAVELHGVSASVTVTDGPNHLFIIFSSLSLTLRNRLYNCSYIVHHHRDSFICILKYIQIEIIHYLNHYIFIYI